ncbi:hypothetical protein A3C37_05080 [Candidatus Peribacteria bacterium RIFCSPHIGHO2_02_FULL_53_20]|nr:MAG: hypothetical protein A3C37_05080 [Candidatus Peribacteria bacterium RIFCSPHIGHO2_02_FULL_53_20]OGJ67354.1 MAG: hypothetical protein A3B61_03115 [Candidatus Peribacteria bacterium RIFCSPLOWO2_01_FULL_53_10]OGJ70084.1 MAG: hypothetical protein A3G69_02995 [Candidatus Peribacteria bacterium RIFCSPLOWO2_12_FULL_53_10]
MKPISEKHLNHLYIDKQCSMSEIAKRMKCSVHSVQYWMKKFGIPSRSRSDAAYLQHNPDGDPFTWSPPRTQTDHILYGLGIGLYWGEGTKSCKTSVRLGNTDPELLKTFMRFLIRFFRIRHEDFRFGLQIFSDIDPEVALQYWIKTLHVKREQFHKKVIVSKSGSMGTYRKKSVYGVVTVHYHNSKLRNMLVSRLPL